MKATIKELQALLQSNNRQEMEDYLMTHTIESREEAELMEKLRDRELYLRDKESSLRKNLTTETKKTEKLLKNSQRNRANG